MIRITLAGQPAMECGSIRLDRRHLGGPQARVAFGVLVMGRQRGVLRDELADVLWPERLPATWEAALRLVISHVRAFLAAGGLAQPSLLTSASGTYRLYLPADAEVDVEAAAEALHDAEGAAENHAWSVAERLAASARDVLAQPFLAGCDGPWVDQERARLKRLHVRALELVSRAALARGRATVAVSAATEAIGQEPYRESAHRVLIESHLAAGQKAAALSAYDECRRLLVEHLGVDPSPATEALYQRVVASSALVPGRRTECHALSELWTRTRRGSTEIVLVRGEAGSGKSHLLAWFAAQAALDGASVVTDGLPGARPSLDDARTADACVAWLVARAAHGPVVAIMDDIHEATAPALQVLRLLARGPRTHALMVVAAHRDIQLPPNHPLAMLRRDRGVATRIALEPLGRSGVAELAAALGVVASPLHIAYVRRQSGGNARLATELLRSTAVSSNPALAVVVNRHVEALSLDALQVLTAAATIGEQFDLRVVQDRVALDEDTVLDALDELIAAGLAAPVPQNADTCVFRHPIVRSVLAATGAP